MAVYFQRTRLVWQWIHDINQFQTLWVAFQINFSFILLPLKKKYLNWYIISSPLADVHENRFKNPIATKIDCFIPTINGFQFLWWRIPGDCDKIPGPTSATLTWCEKMAISYAFKSWKNISTNNKKQLSTEICNKCSFYTRLNHKKISQNSSWCLFQCGG